MGWMLSELGRCRNQVDGQSAKFVANSAKSRSERQYKKERLAGKMPISAPAKHGAYRGHWLPTPGERPPNRQKRAFGCKRVLPTRREGSFACKSVPPTRRDGSFACKRVPPTRRERSFAAQRIPPKGREGVPGAHRPKAMAEKNPSAVVAGLRSGFSLGGRSPSWANLTPP